MSDPTALEFAARYKAPAPADFSRAFDDLTPSDKTAAMNGIKPYREMCARMRVNPICPKVYLRMRIWSRVQP